MAFDAKLAVQVAIYEALTVTALPGGSQVYEHVPDEAEPPLTLIDKITLTPAGGKGGGLDLAEFDIVSLMRAAGREFLSPIMAEVRARLEDRALTAVGATLSRPVFVSDDDGLLDDAITYFGTQRFSLFVQPA